MNTLHAVAYTDGGCRPNTGYGGAGLHGYVYTLTPAKKGTGLKEWVVTPFGYLKREELAKKETMRQDVVASLTDDFNVDGDKFPDVQLVEYWDYSKGLPFPSTNNVAETQAAFQALAMALEKGVSSLRIITDSQYVIQGINEWLPRWKDRDFVDKNDDPISNRTLWVAISDYLDRFKEKGIKLKMQWVKGHSDHVGNNHADYQATLGVIASRKSHFDPMVKISDPEGYWSPKVDTHPLMTMPRWYFNTSAETPADEKGRYTYHFGTHGKDDDFIGKPVADAAFSIVKLPERIQPLEAVRVYHNKIVDSGLVRVVVARTDFIRQPRLYKLLSEHDDLYMTQQKILPDAFMYTPNSDVPLKVSRELSPPRTSYHLIETMADLEQKLAYYESGSSFDNLRYTDITALLYETKDKAKGKQETKLLSHVTSVMKGLDVNVNIPLRDEPFPITLSFGIDLPSRNELSKIAAMAPKVTVMTWRESPQAFRAATVIETTEGIGIWSGCYSNIHIIS